MQQHHWFHYKSPKNTVLDNKNNVKFNKNSPLHPDLLYVTPWWGTNVLLSPLCRMF
jgi:hypothetical protein